MFQLQEDFIAGKLKPGLNVALPASVDKPCVNDVVRYHFFYLYPRNHFVVIIQSKNGHVHCTHT